MFIKNILYIMVTALLITALTACGGGGGSGDGGGNPVAPELSTDFSTSTSTGTGPQTSTDTTTDTSTSTGTSSSTGTETSTSTGTGSETGTGTGTGTGTETSTNVWTAVKTLGELIGTWENLLDYEEITENTWSEKNWVVNPSTDYGFPAYEFTAEVLNGEIIAYDMLTGATSYPNSPLRSKTYYYTANKVASDTDEKWTTGTGEEIDTYYVPDFAVPSTLQYFEVIDNPSPASYPIRIFNIEINKDDNAKIKLSYPNSKHYLILKKKP